MGGSPGGVGEGWLIKREGGGRSVWRTDNRDLKERKKKKKVGARRINDGTRRIEEMSNKVL